MAKYVQTDMFVQAIKDKTEQYERAREKIQKQIDDIERASNRYDSGLGDIEDRNELNYLHRELEHLESKYKKDIAALTVSQNSK